MTEKFDNRYEIIRRLGSGGMADVYLARDTHLGRDVAIKMLYKRYANDEEFVARFRQEAQSAAGLNHPHIVSIYDRGEAEGSYYIAMEYLEGQSLKDLIAAKGRLEPAEAIGTAEQILQALSFAHEHHVIHRDIKPHNIVVSGRGDVKVTDFGIARAGSSSRMTETGSIIGTAQYLSPEQAKGKAVEQSSDLYSLGIVLYEMLTGQVPFEGENAVAIALKHLSDEPVPPQALVPDISDNLNAVVMRALAKDPADRYQSAEELLADLERCRHNLPVTVPPSTDSEKTAVISAADVAAGGSASGPMAKTAVRRSDLRNQEKPAARKKWLWLSMAALALALIAAGIMFLAFTGQPASAEVPDVVNLPYQQAQDAIRAQGLTPVLDSEEFSDTVPSGNVVRQTPDARTMLRVDDGNVRLVISKGANRVPVPDVVGQSASYADSKLREAGLAPDRQPDVYSATVAEGSVISQDPPGGSQIQKGSAVKYVVSKGPQPPKPPKQVTVPGIVGMDENSGQAKLEQVGLVLGNVAEQFSDTMASGQIISQNPAAGELVNEGSAVGIVVSKGKEPPEQVSVPGVEGMNRIDAENLIASKGLVPQTTTQTTPDATKWNKVKSQSPGAGTMVNSGSSVNIVVWVTP